MGTLLFAITRHGWRQESQQTCFRIHLILVLVIRSGGADHAVVAAHVRARLPPATKKPPTIPSVRGGVTVKGRVSAWAAAL